jgi:hypothetical protein
MTTVTQQTQQIIDYVQAFFDKTETEDINTQWQSEENRKAINNLLKKFAKRTSSDKIKDPNKPKRCRSAYILFCTDERSAAKSALDEGTPPTQVTSELARRWKQLKESTKPKDKRRYQKYVDASTADKKRYDDEMVDYVLPSDEELEHLAANKPKRGRKSIKKKVKPTTPQETVDKDTFVEKPVEEPVKKSMWTDEEIEIFKNYTSVVTGLESGRAFKDKVLETAREVKRLIERYGDTGFGKKPEEMNRVEYWLSHLQ